MLSFVEVVQRVWRRWKCEKFMTTTTTTTTDKSTVISHNNPPPLSCSSIWTNLNLFHPRMLCAKFVFSLFLNYLPLEKGGAIHLYKLESPPTKDALCQAWLKLVQWFWRRISKCEKFTTTTTTTTTMGHILIRKAQFSLRLRWAKKIMMRP